MVKKRMGMSAAERSLKEARHVVRSPEGNVIGTRVLRLPTSTLAHG